MRHLKRYILLLSLPLLYVVSCKDFLEEEAFTSLDPDTFFDDAGAVSALNNCYLSMLSKDYYRRNWFYINEYVSDAVTTRRPGSDFRGQWDNYRVTPTTSGVSSVYNAAFIAVNKCNFVLQELQQADRVSADISQRVRGEALFLRGLNYYNLVSLYGGVPIVETVAQSLPGYEERPLQSRRAASEVYAFIIEDLRAAESLLPLGYTQTRDIGRATRGAVQALLAKVYLQRGSTPSLGTAEDYVQARDWARKVIEGGQYELIDFEALWGLDVTTKTSNNILNESNAEIIFDLQRMPIDGMGHELSPLIAPRNSGVGHAQWTNFHAELPFFLSYDTADIRRQVTFILEYPSVDGGEILRFDPNDPLNDNYDDRLDGPAFAKYIDPGSKTNEDSENNIIVLRYADLLLCYAEALNETDGPGAALAPLNEVVRRAFRATDDRYDYKSADFNGDKEEFRRILYEERRKELVMEGHGWQDGQRFFSIFKEKVEANSRSDVPGNGKPDNEITLEEPKNRLLPIPQSVIDNDPAITQEDQNPGW